MQKLIAWIKTNKALSLAALVIVWLAWPRVETIFYTNTGFDLGFSNQKTGMYDSGYESVGLAASSSYYPYEDPYAPTDSSDRMVVKNASIAMLVNDVVDTETKITSHVESVGGYVVTSNISRPTESPYSTMSLRIPSDSLDSALDFFNSLSVKVTSQSISGRDVTDQYTDIQAHIDSLTKTKTRYESIRDNATEVSDLITVTREITTIQNQIRIGRRHWYPFRNFYTSSHIQPISLKPIFLISNV